MSKYDAAEDMYIPFEIKLRYPEKPDPDALWSDVWRDAFVKVKEEFVKEKSEKLCDLETGIQTLRMAELSNISLQKGGLELTDICLSAN